MVTTCTEPHHECLDPALKITSTKVPDIIKVRSFRWLHEPQGYSELNLKITAFEQYNIGSIFFFLRKGDSLCIRDEYAFDHVEKET